MFFEARPYILRYFKDDVDAMNNWLFCKNYLWGYFTPMGLMLSGDDRPVRWIKLQLENKEFKNRFNNK